MAGFRRGAWRATMRSMRSRTRTKAGSSSLVTVFAIQAIASQLDVGGTYVSAAFLRISSSERFGTASFDAVRRCRLAPQTKRYALRNCDPLGDMFLVAAHGWAVVGSCDGARAAFARQPGHVVLPAPSQKSWRGLTKVALVG